MVTFELYTRVLYIALVPTYSEGTPAPYAESWSPLATTYLNLLPPVVTGVLDVSVPFSFVLVHVDAANSKTLPATTPAYSGGLAIPL